MTTRERVERKLGHNQFRLQYQGDGVWGIFSLTGDVMGFAHDFWPYFIVIY